MLDVTRRYSESLVRVSPVRVLGMTVVAAVIAMVVAVVAMNVIVITMMGMVAAAMMMAARPAVAARALGGDYKNKTLLYLY